MKSFTGWSLLISVAVMLSGCNEIKSSGESSRPEQSVMVTAANETAAMARLRAIAVAEASYQAETAGAYAMLDQLIDKRYVNNPSSGKLTGYRFEVRVKPGGFEITAVPEKFGVTGKRSFYIDETNILRAADKRGAPATASDPES